MNTQTIIKAISLHQPWASFIPMGLKNHETRSWYTSYRGKLLICSAKKKSTDQKSIHNYLLSKYQEILTETDNYLEWVDLPFGSAIALVDLTDCIKMSDTFIQQQPQMELDTGGWQVGRFAWKLENIRRIVPAISITGQQGLFDAEVCLDECRVETIPATATAIA